MDDLVERYLNYNADEDPSGSQGIAIANSISERCGHDPGKIKQLIKNYDAKRAELDLALKRLGKTMLEKSLSSAK